MTKEKLLIILILVFAAFIRLIFLPDFPKGFSGDEVQQGYSAYSILKTGNDEWGDFLPINPRGFGDFKPPLLTYSLIPSIAVFGLNEFAIRLPMALVGILLVFITYLLVVDLFGKRVALWSSLFLAFSPWHIQLSRTAFEGGLGISIACLGLLFFLKGLKKVSYLYLSAICWGLTLYTYHSFRVFTILFIIFLWFLFKQKINIKKFLLLFALFSLFLLPIVFNLRAVLTRSSDVGIFNSRVINDYFAHKGVSNLPPLIDKAIDNKFAYLLNVFYKDYLSYYSPSFFFTSDRPDNSYLNFPGFPLLYPLELAPFLLGLLLLIVKNDYKSKLLIGWFLLAAVPASLAFGSMSANRAVTFLPVVVIISALGFEEIIDYLSIKFKIKRESLNICAIFILVLSFIYFINFYFFKMPQNTPTSLRPEYKGIFTKIISLQNQYDQIVISKVFSQPQIFLAFYSQMDPREFQSSSKDWLRYEKSDKLYIDQLESWNLGKYYFEGINWYRKDSERKNSLIVASIEDFPPNIRSVDDVLNNKKEIIYKFVSTK